MGNSCLRRLSIASRSYEAPPPRRMRAKFDYSTDLEGDLSFKKGDLFEVLDESGELWWQVRKVDDNNNDNNIVGFVAKDYLAECGDGPRSFDCWFEDYDRSDAERHLRLPSQREGAFLLRPYRHGDRSTAAFVISVRDKSIGNMPQLMHIAVRSKADNKDFYLERNLVFPTARQLVQHYGQPGNRYQMRHECTPMQSPMPTSRQWQLQRERIKLGNRMGDGMGGQLHEAYLDHSTEVVTRTFARNSSAEVSDLQRKVEQLHSLNHSKLAKVFGVCEEPEALLTVSEFVNGVPLDAFLRRRVDVDYPKLLDMLIQIADAMTFLESREIVHGRLRAANVVLDANNQCLKLTDFGLTSGPGRVRWRAVECLDDDDNAGLTVKSDVWSFGVTAFEILSLGARPYHELEDDEVSAKVKEGERPGRPEGDRVVCSERMHDLLQQCWLRQPLDRPNFRSVKEMLETFARLGEDGDYQYDGV